MIELLGARAAHAVGIDRSAEMLRLARAKMSAAGMERAELRQGDMYAVPLGDAVAELVVLHQVLHYAQAPAEAIAEATRLLAPGGRLLIVDFAAHDREELREREGHARLGFADEQMLGWFAAAGVKPVRTDMLVGGELTVKLWLGRRELESQQLEAAA
jgi:ArsR family transcriptional regulator